jgi:hypothetical protein
MATERAPMTEEAREGETALQASVRHARELVLRNRAAGPNEVERAARTDAPSLRQHGELAQPEPAVDWLEE